MAAINRDRRRSLCIATGATLAGLAGCVPGREATFGGAAFDPRHDVASPLPAARVPESPTPSSVEFRRQWYERGAELSRFEVIRRRYGEPRRSRAVFVFVTEPFRRDALVKADTSGGEATVDVLKLNWIERFTTGIYDYSLMTSAFTPLEDLGGAAAGGLSTTTSIQDWCGHTWLQWRREADALRGVGHSYFERENQRRVEFERDVWLEDGLWSLVRISPARLPLGEVRMMPAAFHVRLDHRDLGPRRAVCELHDVGDGVLRYAISYPDARREMSIVFAAEFPHSIESFRETVAGDVVTEGVRVATEMLPY